MFALFYLIFLNLIFTLASTDVLLYDGYDYVMKFGYGLNNATLYSTHRKTTDHSNSCRVVVVHGEFKTGKTWLLNLLFMLNLPSEQGYSTVGISYKNIKYKGNNYCLFDVAGSNELYKKEHVISQEGVERIIDHAAWEMDGTHIFLVNSITAESERRLMDNILKTKASNIIVIYNLQKAKTTDEYLRKLAALEGDYDTIREAKCGGENLTVLSKFRVIDRPFQGGQVDVRQYLVFDNDTDFGKCLNGVVLDDLRENIKQTKQTLRFNPVSHIVESIRVALKKNTDINTAEIDLTYNAKLDETDIINMDTNEHVQGRKDDILTMIAGYFMSYFISKPKFEIPKHVHIGYYNVTKDGKSVVVSRATFPQEIYENETTTIIEIDAPGFIFGQTLKVVPVKTNRAAVEVYFLPMKRRMDMVSTFNSRHKPYGKLQISPKVSFDFKGYNFCLPMTEYVNGQLILVWHVHGTEICQGRSALGINDRYS